MWPVAMFDIYIYILMYSGRLVFEKWKFGLAYRIKSTKNLRYNVRRQLSCLCGVERKKKKEKNCNLELGFYFLEN